MRTNYIDFPTRSIANLSDMGVDDNNTRVFELNRIKVTDNNTGKGIGRSLMQEVLQDADRDSVILVLDINPYGPLSFEELESWYMRLGFLLEKGRYYRKPRALKHSIS